MITFTDLFAGAGGSSTGAAQVPGVEIRIAAWEAAGETVSIRGTAGRIDRHVAQEGVMPHV